MFVMKNALVFGQFREVDNILIFDRIKELLCISRERLVCDGYL